MKINEKNLAAFAKSNQQVDREGYLMKKGEANKNFSKRWFVLKGNLLFYFERKTDKEPLGVIILEGSTIELTETELEQHYCFKIVFPSRSYILSADSQSSMESWMKALACASFDYVKLMAAELQRQLLELTKDDSVVIKACTSNPFNNIASLQDEPSSSYQRPSMVPTPPPRHKQNRAQKQKRTFAMLHEEFGTKILEDHRARQLRLGSASDIDSVNSNLTTLSLSKNSNIIEL